MVNKTLHAIKNEDKSYLFISSSMFCLTVFTKGWMTSLLLNYISTIENKLTFKDLPEMIVGYHKVAGITT